MFGFSYPRQRINADEVKIICHGNSHTAGEGAANTSLRWTSIMQTVPPLLGTGVTVINSGIGGQSTTAMIGNAPTAVDAHLDPTKLNILFAQEGGNEMAANGRNATAAHTKWRQYCEARYAAAAAAGARLFIITVGLHPTGAGATAAITNERMAANILYNQLLRKHHLEYCDMLLDMGEHVPFKGLFEGGDYSVAAFAATGMYNRATGGDGQPDDRVHFGNAGHAREGRSAANALTRIPAPIELAPETPPVEDAFPAETFNSIYVDDWTPDNGMDTVVTPAQAMPAKSTSATTGGYVDANFGAFVTKLAQPSDTNDPGMGFLRHDYSRRSPWNADGSKYVLLGENGWWQLFDAATNARIDGAKVTSPGVGALEGPSGQCEWCWHQTDPNRAVHTGNNGSLLWYVHDLETQASTVWFDLEPKLQALGGAWATASRSSFKGEGMPSRDWRYFCLLVTTDGFGTIGVIRYDSVLDQIVWALPLTNTPDHVSTSPLTGKPVVSWYGAAETTLADEQANPPDAAAGARVFMDDNDQQGVALCVVGEHSDLFIDHLGREAFTWISFHGNADGVTDGDVAWCLLDDPAQRWSVPVGVFPEEPGVGVGVHLSGCCWDRPGYTVVSIYSGTGENPHSGRVMVCEMVPGGEVYRVANNYSDTTLYDPETESGLAYAAEPQAVPNRDLTRIMWASNMGVRANGIMPMQAGLPSWAFPPAGLVPLARLADPTISGTATQGGTLTRTLGTYEGFPVPVVTGRWESRANSGAAWAAVSGETGPTLVVPAVADGTEYRWGNEIATQEGGAVTTAVASNVAVVAALATPANLTLPTVPASATSTEPTVGTAGTWSGNPVPTLSPMWQRDIGGTWTDSGITMLTASLSAGTWRLRVSASNSQGGPVVATSASVVVAAVPQFVQVSPAAVGEAPVLGGSTPSGNLLLIDIAQSYGANPPREITSVVDSVDAAPYTLVRSQVTGDLRVDTYLRVAAASGARSAAVTLAGAGNYTAFLTEYSGATAVSGTPVGAAGSSTSPAPGTVTPPGLAIYHCVMAHTGAYYDLASDPAYTQRAEIEFGTGAVSMNISDRTGSGASTPVLSMSASGAWVAQLVALA